MNVSFDIRQKVIATFKNSNINNNDILSGINDIIECLDICLSKIYSLILNDSFIRFKKSHQFKKLSKGELPHPLNNLKDILPQNNDTLNIIRDTHTNMSKDRIYIPDYYRKDRLPQNDIGSEEMRPFVSDNSESESAWTDENVSEHPKFYTSDVQSDFTNIGLFFDKNNQYHDKTSSNTDVLASDECYTDKKGTKFCMDNTRIQNIPPQLITNPKSCYALNDIGLYIRITI